MILTGGGGLQSYAQFHFQVWGLGGRGCRNVNLLTSEVLLTFKV